MSIFTPHFGQAVWVKGHHSDEWHYAPFSATQRHLACGKLTPTAREVRVLGRVLPKPVCSNCLKTFTDDCNLRMKSGQKNTVDKSSRSDSSESSAYFAREDGKFGSHPAYDAMDDEAKP